ncbi:MAG TPA: hypothetical protein VEJ86_07095, partial [Candidatus Binataceae bacterium]|nr:hypothetical protein [Candidatus Binataceae bacterium]
GAQELRQQINEAKAVSTDPAERLRITIATVLDDAAESPEVFRIVFGHSPAFLTPMRTVYEPFIADITADLTPAVGARAETLANLIVGMLTQAISQLLDEQVSLDQLKQTTTEFALGGLERAMRSGAAH